MTEYIQLSTTTSTTTSTAGDCRAAVGGLCADTAAGAEHLFLAGKGRAG